MLTEIISSYPVKSFKSFFSYDNYLSSCFKKLYLSLLGIIKLWHSLLSESSTIGFSALSEH